MNVWEMFLNLFFGKANTNAIIQTAQNMEPFIHIRQPLTTVFSRRCSSVVRQPNFLPRYSALNGNTVVPYLNVFVENW